MRCTLLLFLIALIAPATHAQNEPEFWVHPDYTARQWTVRDGLPSNTINALAQASDGYLWLGTNEGLVRFDGHTFTTFNATNTPALSNNRIGGLEEKPTGYLWVAHDAGGNLVLYRDGRFTRFEAQMGMLGMSQWTHVEGDTVWIEAHNGLWRYANDHLERYRPDVLDGQIKGLRRDREGQLWVGAFESGLYRFDASGTVHQYLEDVGFDLLLDRQDRVWYSTASTNGPLILRIDGDRVETIHQDVDWVGGLSLDYEDAQGNVWITSALEGWWQHTPSGERTLFPKTSPLHRAISIHEGPQGHQWRQSTTQEHGYEEYLLYRDDVLVFRVRETLNLFAFDDRGSLWIGTGLHGLFRLQHSLLQTVSEAEGLPERAIYPILEDRDGRIWVGTFGGGLVQMSPTLEPTALDLEPFSLITSLFEDRRGTIWVGKLGSTCYMQGDLCQSSGLPEGISHNVRAIHEDRRGRLWLGSEFGLLFGEGAGTARAWTQVESQDGLPRAWVRAIHETRNGTLLFGTNGDGLLRFVEGNTDDPFDVLSTEEGLPSAFVRDIYEDRDGYLWIALEDEGLCRLDRQGQPTLAQGDLRCLDSRHGLYQSGLHRILEDDHGRFWFNTNNGIFWVERDQLQAFFAGAIPSVTSVSYTEAEGMRNREGNGGVQPAGIKASDGRLWFPTQDGVVIIDPGEVPLPEAPPVRLEGVQVGEEVRRADAGVVELAPSERDVTLRYTALEFARSEDVRFQYQLEGYDEGWIDGGTQRQTTYTNLSPGSYTFAVRAGIGGVWSEAASLELEREPYFWQTTWFLVLVGLVLLSAGPAIYTFRVRQLKAHKAELEQMVDERTAELRRANELKSRFLANISHEFRTPLTLTFGPIDDLLKGRFGPIEPARPHFERARRNGHRLLRLINQLLDLSKLDAGALLLHPRPYDLAQHLRQMTALFESLSVNKGLHLHTEISQEPVMHVYDADKIEKVVINLLSNAFKFTPPGGKISLTFEQEEDGTACIEVADTGPGIAKEDLPQLFDRFYQVDSDVSRAHEGSGIGLSLVKEMVELHQGTVTVKSKVGFGTTFTVRLPLLEVEAGDAPSVAETPATHEPEEQARQAHVLELAPAEESAPGDATQSKTQNPNSPIEETVVLVVEDNPDMRAYIRAHLDDRFTVLEAENGRVGVERAQEEVPDLILSDVMMPVMDGLEACSALKADERTSHIPVVLLTARATVEHRIEGFESGADAYLPKPFNAEELQVRVRTMVEERRRLRSLFAGTGTPSRPPVEEEIAGDGAEAVVEEPVRPTLPPREAAFVEKVVSLIQEHLGDGQFGVDALAEMVSMSRRQVHRKLVALTDETPAVMIRHKRMERASELLREGGLSMKEVSYAVGFQSESSFGRAFRQAYGVAPSTYLEETTKSLE